MCVALSRVSSEVKFVNSSTIKNPTKIFFYFPIVKLSYVRPYFCDNLGGLHS